MPADPNRFTHHHHNRDDRRTSSPPTTLPNSRRTLRPGRGDRPTRAGPYPTELHPPHPPATPVTPTYIGIKMSAIDEADSPFSAAFLLNDWATAAATAVIAVTMGAFAAGYWAGNSRIRFAAVVPNRPVCPPKPGPGMKRLARRIASVRIRLRPCSKSSSTTLRGVPQGTACGTRASFALRLHIAV